MRTLRNVKIYKPEWQPDTIRLSGLALALALVILPHLQRVPVWVSLTFILLASWRLATAAGRIKALPRFTIIIIEAAVVLGVYINFGTLFGRNAGVALLVCLAGLKLLETRTRRDAFVCLLLGYFLVVTNLLYSQSIVTGIYLLFVVIIMTATLTVLNTSSSEISPVQRLKLSSSMLVYAFPVAIFLFLFFPRIQGPLWGLPADAHGAVSGLSDSMSPGMISKLGRSDAVAFKVTFEGTPPAPADRYWRGPVFWNTDGKRWWGDKLKGRHIDSYPENDSSINYRVTLEAHNKKWIFLLDAPSKIPKDTYILSDYRVIAKKSIKERMSYEASSTLNYRYDQITNSDFRKALFLPEDSHLKTRQLAEQWHKEFPQTQDYIRKVLEYFNQEAFFYTLNPTRLSGDVIDNFLFESRRGFCEHYATAFTVLTRAAGIPTRIVTGYQGGEINPIDGHMVIRQQDAHAWVEVWIDKQGWTRIDPTAAVAPNRVEFGMEQTLSAEINSLNRFNISSDNPLYEVWKRARYSWDAANYWWSQWVLGYGPDKQDSLLSEYGIDINNWKQVGMIMFLFIGAIFLLIAMKLFLDSIKKVDTSRKFYNRFIRKLKRKGVAISDFDGPVDIARKAAKKLPLYSTEIDEITKAYINTRYRRNRNELIQLKRTVGNFRP